MNSFANLKRNSGSNLDKLSKAIDSMAQAPNPDMDKYWKLEPDKAGNGYAVIRFLPAPPQDGDDAFQWVKYYDHGFQGPTGLWYIEKSLTSIGLNDDIGDLNRKLWESGIESNKELARKQKRRLHYVSNIYVIKDPKHPENEGQIKLFSYGSSIFDKIKMAVKPEFPDEEPMEPFDFWRGANFKLKARKADGYVKYDLSEFDSPAPLFDDDEKLEHIYNNLHSLSEIVDPKNFKTREELKARLDKVLCLNTSSPSNLIEEIRQNKIEVQEKAMEKEFAEIAEDDNDDLKYFSSLLED